MADLIYAMNPSLDGFVADPDGNFDWGAPSDDAHGFFNELQRSTGTLLCGRRLYETMRVWDEWSLDELPPVQRDFAEAWANTDKVVYSTTLEKVTEPRTRLERVFDPRAVRALKDGSERYVAIGGPHLAGEAIRAGLIDRILLRVVPVIVGGGTPVLPDRVRADLVLGTTRRFEDGSVLLDYRMRRQD